MAYIGRDITSLSNASLLDDITFSSSAGPYNLTKSTVAFTPISAQALVISIDGVIQDPGSYTISGSTVTFDTSISSSCTNDFIVHNGVGIVNEVSDGAVTAAKLGTDAVTTAKILDNNVTVAKLPTTLDISGNTVTLPASVSGLGTGIDVTSQITGTVPTANLGSGTASSSTYLAGDSTYKTITAQDISWQSVETGATFTAVAGNGYPVNTTAQACTVTLPASASVGDEIVFTDYARNFATNALTINPNSLNYQGNSSPNPVYDTAGESIHIVYMDATKGWIPTNDGAVAMETPQSYDIEYLIVGAGGGGGFSSGGSGGGGGGGAGGYRTNYDGTGLSLTGGNTYTVTVGGGGAGGTSDAGTDGGDSILSGTGITTITSTGGGAGAGMSSGDGEDGGSGGGGTGASSSAGGSGTAYGNDGGSGANAGGGGGGAGAVGTNASVNVPGVGGNGTANSITGSSVTYAGGGGGGAYTTVSGGAGGSGGGGRGGDGNGNASIAAGTDGLGGGGGGAGGGSGTNNGAIGGDGIVILRMADGDAGTPSGEDSVATDVGGSGETVITWLATGSYVA